MADSTQGSLRRLPTPPDPRGSDVFVDIGELAFSRTSGAALVHGNEVRILKDADENYPAWLAALSAAKRVILFENYIFEEDSVGQAFADVLMERAKAGVRVYLVRDWLGSAGRTSAAFWQTLEAAGVEVRCFNPPSLESPFGWLSRDHRKMIAVDNSIAFVTGLCISQRWNGDPARGIAPWRDTGVELRGPCVRDVENAFAQMWQTMGSPLPLNDATAPDVPPPAGDVSVRVLAGTPNTAHLLRTDELIAAISRRSLWLTDAYFVGVSTYVQALRAAARDGVDVRLLVPNATDLPFMRPLSRTGYRPLLEAGVRIFEWNGPMIHAKTAVCDGRWTRVGSSNLNAASFLGNYELDIAIDDLRIARRMEEMYEDDLRNATEIVLERNRVVRTGEASRQARRGKPRNDGTGSTAAASALRIVNTMGAAVTNRRVLGRAEAKLLFMTGAPLLLLAAAAAIWPRVVAVPFCILGFWTGGALLLRAFKLRRTENSEPENQEEL